MPDEFAGHLSFLLRKNCRRDIWSETAALSLVVYDPDFYRCAARIVGYENAPENAPMPLSRLHKVPYRSM